MADEWRDQRWQRATDPARTWRVIEVDSPEGGALAVEGELLITAPAVGFLTPDGPGPDPFATLELLDTWTAFGLAHYRVTDGEPVLDVVDRLRRALDEGGVGLDPQFRVSLNHAVSGEPFYHGGPQGAPAPATSWGPSPRAADLLLVAVLDTGIVPSSIAPYATNVRYDPADVDGVYVGGAPNLGSQGGHGTFVTGLVERMTGGAAVRAVRVLDPDGWGKESAIISVLHTLPRDLAVVNMSFGMYTPDDRPPLLCAAIAALRGTVVVAAAGNAGLTRPYWPAASPQVVAVAALARDGDGLVAATWSNHGSWVDVATMGEGLLSTYVTGEFVVSAATGQKSVFHDWAHWDGTSFAAPLVSAEIARRVTLNGGSATAAYGSLLAQLPPPAPAGTTLAGYGRVYDPRTLGMMRDPRIPW